MKRAADLVADHTHPDPTATEILAYLKDRIPGYPFNPHVSPGSVTRGSEVPCAVVFSTLGARSRTRKFVEHPEARKRRWVRCIADRSRKLVRYAG